MSANPILERCRELGVDKDRLVAALDSHDGWGKLVHAFEYLTVLGVVADAFKAEADASETEFTPWQDQPEGYRERFAWPAFRQLTGHILHRVVRDEWNEACTERTIYEVEVVE